MANRLSTIRKSLSWQQNNFIIGMCLHIGKLEKREKTNGYEFLHFRLRG